MVLDERSENLTCSYSVIDCEDRNNNNQFEIDNKEFKTASIDNSLEYGDIVKPGYLKLKSKNGKFTLELFSDGLLRLKKLDIDLWTNEMALLADFKNIRLRINEKGHLVEEVKGLFSENFPDYRNSEWITVWSSAPIHHNTTIGIPNIIDKTIG